MGRLMLALINGIIVFGLGCQPRDNNIIRIKRMMFHSVETGDTKTLNQLLGQYPTIIDAVDSEMQQYTLLHSAAMFKRADIVALLAKNGASVNCRTRLGRTPLHLAAETNDRSSIEILLQAKANPTVTDQNGSMPLHLAANAGGVEVARLLLAFGAPIDAVDTAGSPLHYAAIKDDIAFAQLLIRSGANVNCLNRKHESALDLAAFYGSKNTCELLKQSGAADSLFTLVLADDLVKLKKLLKQSNPHFKDSKANTLIHLAAKSSGSACLKFLLTKKYDVNERNRLGQAPLHYACLFQKVPSVQLLLQAGADVNITDHQKTTPLHIAADLGMDSAIMALLRYGAKSTPNIDGNLPLHLAIRAGHNEIAKSLIDSESQVNHRNFEGDTPLHYAVSYQRHNIPLVRLLLNNGANPHLCNGDGVSSLDIVKNQIELEELLRMPKRK